MKRKGFAIQRLQEKQIAAQLDRICFDVRKY
jgi:hypothetical protein